MADAISGGMYQRIHGIAGKTFFDAFAMHPERRATLVYITPLPSPASNLGTQVSFGNRHDQEYAARSAPSNLSRTTSATSSRSARLICSPKLYAPANYMEAVNTIALPRY